MEFKTKLKKEDWVNFQLHIEAKASSAVKLPMGFVGNLLLWCVLSFSIFIIIELVGEIHWKSVGLCFFMFVVFVGMVVWRILATKKNLTATESGSTYREYTYQIGTDGIACTSTVSQSFIKWPAVICIDRGRGNIMVFLDTTLAIIFPESQIENADELYEYLRSQLKM